MILSSPEELDRLKREKNLVAFPMRTADPSNPTLDILVQSPLDIFGVLERAEKRHVEGIPVQLASMEDMILLKESSVRAQDRADLLHLKRIRRRDRDESL